MRAASVASALVAAVVAMACVAQTGAAKLVEDATIGQKSESFNYLMSQDKTDIDYIPIGVSKIWEPLDVALSVTGWGTSHGLSFRIVSDWYNSRVPKLAANRVTVFFEDNKKGGVDQTVHLDVLYKADGMMMSFYLRVDPKYVDCKQGTCLGYDHNVILRVTGGGSYVSGAVPEGIDAAFDAAKYSTASEVHLASVGGTTSTHMLTRSKLDVDYVPLGSSPVGQPFSAKVSMNGAYMTHGLAVDVVSDHFPTNNVELAEDKVTVFLADNRATDSHDNSDHLGVVYRRIAQAGQRVAYYLRVPSEYIGCGKTNTQCIAADHAAIITASGGPGFIAGGAYLGSDAEFDRDKTDAGVLAKYTAAKVVEMSMLGKTAGHVAQVLTAEKGDVEYVPLGSSFNPDSFQADVTFHGWATEFGYHLDVAATYYNKAVADARPSAASRKAVVYVTDLNTPSSSSTKKAKDYLRVLYTKNDAGYLHYYLEIKAGMVPCVAGSEGYDTCKVHKHTVDVLGSGMSFVAADEGGGVDPDLDDNLKNKKYAAADMVFMSDLAAAASEVEAAQLERLPAAVQDIAALKSALANETKARLGLEQRLADTQQEFADFKAKVLAFMAPVAADAPGRVGGSGGSPCMGAGCTPAIAADGSDVTIKAGGGSVLFESMSCAATDLCNLAQDVAAVKAKFNPQ